MSFATISSLISAKYQSNSFAPKVQAALVCEEFDKIVKRKWGGKMEHLVKAAYLKDGELFVACLSSVVAQEIKLYEKELLQKMSNKAGPSLVKNLRFLI